MNKDGNPAVAMALDEIVDIDKVRKQVLCHAVIAWYENVMAFRNNLLVPGLPPMNPSSM
jgi:hypothetical protein